MRSWYGFTLFLTVASLAPAVACADISFMQFQLNGYAATQAGGGNTFSGQASWNPTLGLGGHYVRGNFAAAVLNGEFDDKFISVTYMGYGGLNLFGGISVEVGAGMQTWISNGGTHPIFGGNLVLATNNWFGVVNRVFAGYSQYLLAGNKTQEFKLGVGIEI